MEAYVTLEEIKNQVNIDVDVVSDDKLLTGLIETSQELVEDYLNVSLTDASLQKAGRLKAPIRHAMKIIVATLYANREDISFATPNCLGQVEMLIRRYKKYK